MYVLEDGHAQARTSGVRRSRVAARRFAVAALAGWLALALVGVTQAAATADTAPAAGTPATVSADALPTVQINGVVWSQATHGNTVYATGDFTAARPAGAASGTQLTTRHYLLAYDITTGNLITSFAHGLNAQGMVAAVSTDGSRLYVGGDFTTVDGKTHGRIAAFDTATGALVSTFTPSLNARVKAIYATPTTVYVGGSFTTADGVNRGRLAAFNASSGALLGWAPNVSNGSVAAMQMSPSGRTLVVGGSFTTIAGKTNYGLSAVDPVTGALKPFAANAFIKDGGANASITSLSTDGTDVIGTGYDFGTGDFEGSFAANGDTGVINWMEDCHGDSYDNFTQNNVTYVVSHAHYCANLPGGGFPDGTTDTWHRALAYTDYRTGTIAHNASHTNVHYTDFFGQPGASLLHWYPKLIAGTFTGQGQAAWSITGNGSYLALGGEFPTVNGIAEQGLVRFAVRADAPNKVGPQGLASLTPTVTSPSKGTAKVSWQATWDMDNQALTYQLVRDGNVAAPLETITVLSNFWVRPTLLFTDTGLASGSTHSYRVYVSDPLKNHTNSYPVSIKVS